MFYLTFDLHFQFSINHNYNLLANFDKIANGVIRARLSIIECRETKSKLKD